MARLLAALILVLGLAGCESNEGRHARLVDQAMDNATPPDVPADEVEQPEFDSCTSDCSGRKAQQPKLLKPLDCARDRDDGGEKQRNADQAENQSANNVIVVAAAYPAGNGGACDREHEPEGEWNAAQEHLQKNH